MKKVVLLSWEILEAGGINSIIQGYQSGFKKLGYEIVTYHASKNGRLMLSEDQFTLNTKWFRPKARNLGWDNIEQLKEYIEDVKQSEFVISIHGCPHPTNSGAKGDYGWHRLYEIPKKFKIPIGIIFTDNTWNKMYSWIADIIDRETVLLYNNFNAGFDSMLKLDYGATFVDYPVDFDIVPKPAKDRKIDVAWMPQWKKIKGIYEFINLLAENPNSFYTVFFNSGIEYYNLRLKDSWKRAIRHENRPRTGPARNTRDYFEKLTYNPESMSDYFGIVYPNQVNRIYANSKISIDLTGVFNKKMLAYYSCCMLEPMINYCTVAASKESAEHQRSRIKGLDIIYPIEDNAVIDSIEELVKNAKLRVQLASRAFDWASEFCRDNIVAKKLIRIMEIST